MLLNYRIIIYIVIFLSSGFVSAQENEEPVKIVYSYKQGYRFIKKAEVSIKEKKYKKAFRLLDKAKRANYGFCGNAWITAYTQIDNLTVEIYLEEKRYSEALVFLDTIGGCGFGADCNKRENLKITALVNLYGKEAVKNAFRKPVTLAKADDYDSLDFDYSVYLPELNYTLKFKDSRDRSQKNKGEENPQNVIQAQEFYKQLI